MRAAILRATCSQQQRCMEATKPSRLPVKTLKKKQFFTYKLLKKCVINFNSFSNFLLRYSVTSASLSASSNVIFLFYDSGFISICTKQAFVCGRTCVCNSGALYVELSVFVFFSGSFKLWGSSTGTDHSLVCKLKLETAESQMCPQNEPKCSKSRTKF